CAATCVAAKRDASSRASVPILDFTIIWPPRFEIWGICVSANVIVLAFSELSMLNFAGNMERQSCTVEDVAMAAGVSTMTVSRAINDRPGVSAEVRRRVLETAASLGYRPSRVARGLASRKTSTLGIVLPDMANPFFAILAKAATDVARAADKNVFIMNTDEDPALEREALDSLAGETIDGVIVAGSRLPKASLIAAISHFDA